MIDAEMRKKIRKSIDISVQEDVLTSNVFGFMSLVDIHLLTVLSHAKHISSNDALKKVFFNQQIKSQSFSLWKQLKNLNIETDKDRDEPDVYFELNDGKKIIVEVKFYSPESDKNQLKDYAMHCDYLIYLTQAKHRKEAEKKYKLEPKIYLLDWKEFNEALKKLEIMNEIESKIIQKIKTYLDHKIGSFWDGWETCLVDKNYESCIFYNSKKDK